MTPPNAASHAARPRRLALQPAGAGLIATATAHMLDARTWARTRFLVDLAMLTLAASAAVFAAPKLGTGPNRVLAALFPLLAVMLMQTRRGADQLQSSALDTAAGVVGAVSSAAVVTIAAASVLGGVHPIGLTLRLWVFAVVYAGLARLVLVSIRSQAFSNRELAMPTLIMGAGSVGDLLVRRMSEDRTYGMRPVGFLDADPMPPSEKSGAPAIPVLGGPGDLADAVAETGARRVILAFSSEPDHVLVDKVAECQKLGVEVLLVPRLFESINDRVTIDYIGEVPLLALRPTNPRSWQFALKHGFDKVVALLSLIVLAPLLAVISLLVRLSSPGPVLFRQHRIGRDGHKFTMLKFRTMRGDPAVVGEADAGWVAELGGESRQPLNAREERTTAVGRFLRKTSFDELPQLLNVVRGDMSLVGPRPERVSYVRDFERLVHRYTDRHRVKSGLTGLSQVNGLRGETSIADRVRYDNYYIQNWSLRLDLKIIMLTVSEVLRFRDSQKARKYGADWRRTRRRG
jgi:exopolysaccharide biosynthesis polyprenyl glycosylphosphotransferase